MRPGPAASYAIDGKQFIAIPMGNELWAFGLDGAVAPRGVPSEEPLSDLVRWVGPAPRETDEIETSDPARESLVVVGRHTERD